MGKHKERTGKSRAEVFLKGLGSVGKPLLDIAGDLTGFKALNVISDAIVTDKNLADYEKQELINLIQLDRQDLINTRNTNAEIQKSEFSSWMAKNVPFLLDLFVFAIWGGLTLFIVAKFFNLVDNENKIDMTGILGIYAGVTGLATQVMSYHRGSSAGSKLKDFLNQNNK